MNISYSVSNLRRIASMPSIELKPITLLLGKNSVGKSTFLRSLPLLRQSVETKSSAPVLWFGDYVDFGNFRGAVTNNDSLRSVTFNFEFEKFSESILSNEYFEFDSQNIKRKKVEAERLNVAYAVRETHEGTARSLIQIAIEPLNSVMTIEFAQNGGLSKTVLFNGEEVATKMSEFGLLFFRGDIFSSSAFVREREGKLKLTPRKTIFVKSIQRELVRYVDGRILPKTIEEESLKILENTNIDEKALCSLLNTKISSFRKIYNNLLSGTNPDLRRRLDEICKIQTLTYALDAAGQRLKSYFGSVEYIGPARARSERFYRQQELEVSDISPDGRNLPMFLASLTKNSLSEFSNWVERVFGYGVSVKKTEGHISINLEQSGKSVNIVDTGYGVSQILPVIAQIWWMKHGTNKPVYTTEKAVTRKLLAIEQPELHLHPAHQAHIADILVEAIQEDAGVSRSQALSFLVETHSESLVNRLGELISKKKISADDVQIVIFSEDENDSGVSVIQKAYYDKEGILQDWPYGFFNY